MEIKRRRLDAPGPLSAYGDDALVGPQPNPSLAEARGLLHMNDEGSHAQGTRSLGRDFYHDDTLTKCHTLKNSHSRGTALHHRLLLHSSFGAGR